MLGKDHEDQFKVGWTHAMESIKQGEDQTEYECPDNWSDWFYCGYNSAYNYHNGFVGKYTMLGQELGLIGETNDR